MVEQICELKAAKYGISNHAVELLLQQSASKLNFSRMDRRVDQAKTELIAVYEEKLASMGLRLPGKDTGVVFQIWMWEHGADGELVPGDHGVDGLGGGWARVSCTITAVGQMLHVGHDVPALRGGKVLSLGAITDFSRQTSDMTIFYNESVSPLAKTQARGFSLTLNAVTDTCEVKGPARRVEVSLENPREAEEMIKLVEVAVDAQRSAMKDGTFEANLIPDNSGVDSGAGQKGPGVVHRKAAHHRLLDEDDNFDHTCTPPSEYETTNMWSSNGIHSDVRRLTNAYADASPALRIIMEELHKMRAEQARASQRQELLASQVQQALSRVGVISKRPFVSSDEQGWGHA